MYEVQAHVTSWNCLEIFDIIIYDTIANLLFVIKIQVSRGMMPATTWSDVITTRD